MRKFITITGYTLFLIGILSVTPVFNLLPVESWSSLINMFSDENTTIYFKVVPSKSGYIINYTIIITGAALIAAGKYIDLKKSNNNE